jgi:hypothetical protein
MLCMLRHEVPHMVILLVLVLVLVLLLLTWHCEEEGEGSTHGHGGCMGCRDLWEGRQLERLHGGGLRKGSGPAALCAAAPRGQARRHGLLRVVAPLTLAVLCAGHACLRACGFRGRGEGGWGWGGEGQSMNAW